MKTNNLIGLLFCFLFSGTTIAAFGQEGEQKGEVKEKFNASTFILEHIADSHEWHLFTKKNGESVALYLPVILYEKEKGLAVFSSRKLAHGHEYKGYRLEEEGELKGRIVNVNEAGVADEENLPLDFSITKTIFGMMFAALIGLLLFISLGRSYKKTGISEPKGIQSFLEPIILFIRDDIAIPNLGEKNYARFMPYLLTAFFFIIINNLMGLIPSPPPFGANVTGNIAVTMVLALCTFFITQFSGNKEYWKDIFAAPGVPVWLLPIMIPVEIIGMFSKPFALMIRLFANITAGHIIVLSLVCLIFIFDSLAIAPVSIFFVIFMDCLELLVAFLQAYIFTLLSALFISLAIPEHHQ
ncbi:MAG TPA: F0F1 ATP synthase subunit A [Bacteroidales bacterium]|nr:F0F1 ATP synthase subunit A [Bacteroidales bacterium]HPT20911.1 F0F1 ATP synthase subunit A [Bacteroidales bacterium]